jgi:hypothetical protein
VLKLWLKILPENRFFLVSTCWKVTLGITILHPDKVGGPQFCMNLMKERRLCWKISKKTLLCPLSKVFASLVLPIHHRTGSRNHLQTSESAIASPPQDEQKENFQKFPKEISIHQHVNVNINCINTSTREQQYVNTPTHRLTHRDIHTPTLQHINTLSPGHQLFNRQHVNTSTYQHIDISTYQHNHQNVNTTHQHINTSTH